MKGKKSYLVYVTSLDDRILRRVEGLVQTCQLAIAIVPQHTGHGFTQVDML
jgi:hypothetical protein